MALGLGPHPKPPIAVGLGGSVSACAHPTPLLLELSTLPRDLTCRLLLTLFPFQPRMVKPSVVSLPLPTPQQLSFHEHTPSISSAAIPGGLLHATHVFCSQHLSRRMGEADDSRQWAWQGSAAPKGLGDSPAVFSSQHSFLTSPYQKGGRCGVEARPPCSAGSAPFCPPGPA